MMDLSQVITIEETVQENSRVPLQIEPEVDQSVINVDDDEALQEVPFGFTE